MPAALKRSKTSTGAAAAAKTPSPKKSFLPKGSKGGDGKVGQAGAAGATPGTKRKLASFQGPSAAAFAGPQFGVKNFADDDYSRKCILKAHGYNVDGVTAQANMVFNKKKGEKQRKLIWNVVGINLQNITVKYCDKDKYNDSRYALKLLVDNETGRRLEHINKNYFRMFWEYTGEGKTLTVDGDGDPEEWRAAVERNFEKIHPGKPMMETLQEMWQNKFGKNSEDAPMPDNEFDFIWEFRDDPGFHKKKKDSNPSTLWAERIKYQPEEDNWLMQVNIADDAEFDWAHLDESGKFVQEKVGVADVRRKDKFHQLRVMIATNVVASTGAPSANFRPVLGNREVQWILSAKRGKLWVNPDEETPEQRAEREAQEAAERAAKDDQAKALYEQQLRAAAGL